MTDEEEQKLRDLNQLAMVSTPPSMSTGYGMVAPPVTQQTPELTVPISPGAPHAG